MKNVNYNKIAKKVIETEINSLKKLKSNLNISFERAVKTILSCKKQQKVQCHASARKDEGKFQNVARALEDSTHGPSCAPRLRRPPCRAHCGDRRRSASRIASRTPRPRAAGARVGSTAPPIPPAKTAARPRDSGRSLPSPPKETPTTSISRSRTAARS